MLAISVVMTIVLAAAPVGAQGGVRVLGSGGSDTLQPPPSPMCDGLVFITEVSFDAAGNPIDIPRFGTTPDLVQVFDVPGFQPVGPGTLELDEVIVYDGHIGRATWGPQLEEQVYFELLLDGVVQATTPPTPDVPDGQLTGWNDIDMGSYELPNGADTLRIRHASANSAGIESLVVSALCGRHTPATGVVVETTVPATTTVPASTTVPSTTEVAVTTTIAADTSDTSITNTTEQVDTEVQGQVEDRPPAPTLAVTGRTQQAAIGFALISVALGLLLVAMGLIEPKTAQ